MSYRRLLILAFALHLTLGVQAEVAPVAVSVPEPVGWVGQRVPFYVELRAHGTFAGTPSFGLPQIPGAIVMKIGEPLVKPEEFEGEEWFVQRHEFALFSQKSGPIEIPAFSVKFARRDGFTGPATDVEGQAEGLAFEIRRPPGSKEIGFLITTESVEVEETWDPQPGPATVGSIFKRTIVQRAEQLTGMALAPAPTTAPDGIRVYAGEASTNDNFNRGEFLGERSETITYLVQKPGTLVLPALTYVWWNPKLEELQSKTLPAVTFEVAAPPVAASPEEPVAAVDHWIQILAAALILGVLAWQRRRIAGWAKQLMRRLNPPDRVAARQLLRSCRRHDAADAEKKWTAWRATQPVSSQPSPELSSALLELRRQRFGPPTATAWQGNDLARAFSDHLEAMRARNSREPASDLPSLNPHG